MKKETAMPIMDRRTFLGYAASLATLAAGGKVLNEIHRSSDDTSAASQVSASTPAASVGTDTLTVFSGQRFGFEDHSTGRRHYVEFDVDTPAKVWRVEGPLACQCWSHAGTYMDGDTFLLTAPDAQGRLRAEILWITDQQDWMLNWVGASSFKLYPASSFSNSI